LLIAVIFPSANYGGSFEAVFIVMIGNSLETAFALKDAEN